MNKKYPSGWSNILVMSTGCCHDWSGWSFLCLLTFTFVDFPPQSLVHLMFLLFPEVITTSSSFFSIWWKHFPKHHLLYLRQTWFHPRERLLYSLMLPILFLVPQMHDILRYLRMSLLLQQQLPLQLWLLIFQLFLPLLILLLLLLPLLLLRL